MVSSIGHRVVFQGGRVFDGTGAAPAEADVTVADGRIVDIGRGLDGDTAVDLSGKCLLPGLFDCHTHVAFTTIDLMSRLQTPFSYRFFEAAHNLRSTLQLGITSIRDAGGADLGIKQAVADGLVPGPRMQISIRMLSQTGGHGDSWMASGVAAEPWSVTYPGSPDALVDGPDEMRKKVRELIRCGADVLKVATSGGVLSPRDNPRHGHFRDEELEVLVAEAAAAGLGVMAHAQAAEGIKAAVRTGIRSIEHGIFLDDEAIAMMLEHGTYLVPTLIAPEGVLDAAEAGAAIPTASLQKAREVIDIHRESFRRAVAAGVKVAMGTDCPVTPHGQNLRELAAMQRGGMTPAAVLVAATKTAAELLGVDADRGTVQPGQRADLVVVDGDPFAFDSLAQRVSRVYMDGRPVVAA
ncbi:MAG TPA: amidohydrolase family protein [Chloroflexota bacterium]|nr:amidohydrolase family protein [Chloroflexota bacterium]